MKRQRNHLKAANDVMSGFVSGGVFYDASASISTVWNWAALSEIICSGQPRLLMKSLRQLMNSMAEQSATGSRWTARVAKHVNRQAYIFCFYSLTFTSIGPK